jgi:hypothetical protein
MAMSRRSPFGEFPQVPLALKQNEALDPVDVSSLGADGIMLASDDVSHLIEQFGVCPPAAFSLRCPTCPRFCPSKPQTQAGLDPKFGYFSWNAQNLDRIRVRPMPVSRMAYLLRLFSPSWGIGGYFTVSRGWTLFGGQKRSNFGLVKARLTPMAS